MKKMICILLLLFTSTVNAEVTHGNFGKNYGIRNILGLAVDSTFGSTSDHIDVSTYTMGAAQFVYAGVNPARVVTLQVSLDGGTSWNSIGVSGSGTGHGSGNSIAVTADGTGSQLFVIPNMGGGLLRMSLAQDATANSQATLTLHVIGKQ
jgi:hypothetical protein